MKGWILLSVAIVAEVMATSALKASSGFSRLWPTVLAVVGYSCAFYFLSLTLRYLPLGVAYAVWAGMGVVLTSLLGWAMFRQTLDIAAVAGMLLIVLGVIVMNVFSSVQTHY